jgi:predicted ABC-type exoprotein transport system permease subunit
MPTVSNFLKGESVAVVSADTTSLTLTFINIMATSSTNTLLKNGDVVYVICADTGLPIELTLDADITYSSLLLLLLVNLFQQVVL